MAEYPHHIRQRNDGVHPVLDEYVLVSTIQILARTDLKVKRRRLVHGILHLVDVPVCAEERSVDDAHIRTDILDLLGIPEREGVIVAMCHKNAVLSHRVEIVLRHLNRCISVASVVVIPVF